MWIRSNINIYDLEDYLLPMPTMFGRRLLPRSYYPADRQNEWQSEWQT